MQRLQSQERLKKMETGKNTSGLVSITDDVILQCPLIKTSQNVDPEIGATNML